MIHLRIVAPPDVAPRAVNLLQSSDSVASVVHLPGAAAKPAGDLILADVAREDASVIVEDLGELGIPESGSITLEPIGTLLSDMARAAERHAAGAPGDAVIWEDVASRTEEMTELSATFVAFMVLAMLICGIGLILDQPILVIGAMVVGPEFGPLAGLCVGLVQRQKALARRSLAALAVGFPVAIVATVGLTLLLVALDLIPGGFDAGDHPLTSFVSQPDTLSFVVAFIAGIVGVLSLTSAKSGALIGVLISVTTLPAAAAMGVALALGESDEAWGALGQLALNLSAIVIAGVLTLYFQRRLYMARRVRHLSDPSRAGAGLPVGRSSHDGPSEAEPGPPPTA
jgi:uncharacterized hydrophobic protein (TIGR00271 family)